MESRAMESRWCVLGGGMLGMTLASRLRQAGREVTLIEAAPDLGGLAAAWRIGEIVWDKHYHVTLLSDSRARAILAELDLGRHMAWTQTSTGFYTGGRHYSMSTSLEFLTFPPLGLISKLRLGATIFHASRIDDWAELENILVEDWLVRWSGRSTFEKMWKPLLRSKLGDAYKRTSAAFIWATIARLYAARRSGMKRELFGYMPGGYARLLDAFAARLRESGVRIRTGRPARRIVSEGDGLAVAFDDGIERFDNVVCTMPPGLAARLIPGLSNAERTLFEGVEYQGIVCASVLLPEPVTKYYVTNITDDGLPFTGVIDMSALVDRKHLGGHGLVYLPKYAAPDDPLFDRTDAEIRDSFLGALERMYPDFRRASVIDFRVSRVRQVFPIPTPGYSRRVPPMKTSIPGLWTVNSSHIVNGTLNVNQTVDLAERATAQMLAVPEPARKEAVA